MPQASGILGVSLKLLVVFGLFAAVLEIEIPTKSVFLYPGWENLTGQLSMLTLPPSTALRV